MATSEKTWLKRLFCHGAVEMDEPDDGSSITTVSIENGIVGYHTWTRHGTMWISNSSGYATTWDNLTLATDFSDPSARQINDAWRVIPGVRSVSLPLMLVTVIGSMPTIWIDTEPGIVASYPDYTQRRTIGDLRDLGADLRWLS